MVLLRSLGSKQALYFVYYHYAEAHGVDSVTGTMILFSTYLSGSAFTVSCKEISNLQGGWRIDRISGLVCVV